MEPPSVSVVIPVYGNEQFLEELARRLKDTLGGLGRSFEVIFVDDGSPDRSWDLIEELSSRHHEVVGLRLSRNFGQHPAISAGFERAVGEVTVLMDADLQDAPEELPRLLELLDDGADVVYTTIVDDGGSSRLRPTSALFHFSFAHVASVSVPPSIGTYRAFNRRFREALMSYPERRALYGPLMLYIGFKTAFVPVKRLPRRGGGSSYGFLKRMSLAIETLVSYTNVPLRVLVFVGSAITFLSIAYLAALVVDYFIRGSAFASGLTLLLGVTLLFMGTVLFSLGVLGTYLFRVFQEVLARPRYLISERVDSHPLELSSSQQEKHQGA
ncbi:MAG: glycosyltransferase family 2 protein [Actinobacteria bacterium]|nr:glycosyltransferase family 2 protein [Actinomycetota bacterium]